MQAFPQPVQKVAVKLADAAKRGAPFIFMRIARLSVRAGKGCEAFAQPNHFCSLAMPMKLFALQEAR